MLLRIGVRMTIFGPMMLLTVRGRKTGKPRTIPVDLHEHNGRRFLIATHGAGNWVHHLRAAGEGILSLGWSQQAFSREIAEFFNTIRYYHIVPQLIRDPERSVGRKFDPFGGDFLEQIASSPKKTQESRLRRIQNALRVAVPQLEELTQYKDDRGVPHLRAKYDQRKALSTATFTQL